jgi:hypothetical protein
MVKGQRRSDRKEFDDLEFYLWRVKYLPSKEWRDEILVMGSDTALETIIESLTSMLDSFMKYGKGTRKFRCNPPEDFDVQNYAQEKKIKFQWLDWLIVKIRSNQADDSQYLLDSKNVIVNYNQKTVQEFIDAAYKQISSEWKHGHGCPAPGGLWFSPDWLGIE